MTPSSVDEVFVDVYACDDTWAQVLGYSGCDVTLIRANVEDSGVGEEGVWEEVEAELRAFCVVV